jgi:hypothetical protein
LACAYEANLSSEEAVLKALEQVGWEEENMTGDEERLCDVLKEKAELLKLQGQQIRAIMRSISSYGD